MLNRAIQTVKKIKGRAFFLFVGIVFGQVSFHVFDYVLYPFVMLKYGPIKGGAMMSLLSITFSYTVLTFYDLTKKDWFGIELVKGLREYDGKKKALKFISWMLSKGQFATFVILSLKFDPFTTTVYLRKGANEFKGMDHKSWAIFVASWAVGNSVWIMLMFTGISIAKLAWKFTIT